MNQKKILEDFFEAYADRFNKGLKDEVDIEGTTKSFAEAFIESSPVGIIAGKNDDSFRESIPKGYAFYKSIGSTGMQIKKTDITELDEFHFMVKVFWHSTYLTKKQEEKSIDFEVFYFVQIMQDEPKIFAYITGDEQKVLKENGLVE